MVDAGAEGAELKGNAPNGPVKSRLPLPLRPRARGGGGRNRKSEITDASGSRQSNVDNFTQQSKCNDRLKQLVITGEKQAQRTGLQTGLLLLKVLWSHDLQQGVEEGHIGQLADQDQRLLATQRI